MVAFHRFTDPYILAVQPNVATGLSISLPPTVNTYRIVNPNAFCIRTMGGTSSADGTVTTTTGYLLLPNSIEVFSLITQGGPTYFSAMAIDSPVGGAAGTGNIEVHFGTGE